jgi:hypothetical protein
LARMTRAEAAMRLGVHKSTIKRWCDKHPSLIQEDGLVDLGELERHRAEHAHPGLQTRMGHQPAPMQTQGTLNDHRERNEKARAETAELDLAERLGLTLRRDEVEAAIAEAAEIMKQTAMQLARDNAERLSLIDDAREMDQALTDMVHQMLTRGAAAIAVRIGQEQDADAA